jgi:uncharacterized cupredoxin-like copper-binding protein
MRSYMKKRGMFRNYKVVQILVLGSIGLLALAAACGGEKTPVPIQAPAQPAAPPVAAAHRAGETHAFIPKRLEAVVEIDMHEFYFATPQGERNPVFRLPSGKTVGIHIHNEGAIVHELMIGRRLKHGDEHGYEESVTELVPSDLFFYYGNVKTEVEDAKFGELEVDTGVRDTWIRMNIPAELKGEWELGCFVEGHYEQGMKATFIVE